MKTTRAKFNVSASKNEDGSMNVSGFAVYHDGNPDHENSKFNTATPDGNLSLHIAKDMPAQKDFENEDGSPISNKEYYLDIIEVEAPAASAE